MSHFERIENLFFTFAYMIAAAAMDFSSVSVITNASRLRRVEL